jgi:hypothetical protein
MLKFVHVIITIGFLAISCRSFLINLHAINYLASFLRLDSLGGDVLDSYQNVTLLFEEGNTIVSQVVQQLFEFQSINKYSCIDTCLILLGIIGDWEVKELRRNTDLLLDDLCLQ